MHRRQLQELKEDVDMVDDSGTVAINVKELKDLISVYEEAKYGAVSSIYE
ncbi:hypothetical protein HUG15_02275 [Salicibibacter cibarius]|uniref:Uncharacterized protein n=1 Tax=Salicibibacter cibarius TaxID=2743000 RepID=A0A7T6Z0B1_9BACI|nr:MULTISPECIES: hypothetical protein [Salicibibacter]QQK74544.1 hypothetical protein HUG15_02275 [Salicibibacter cibarius]